MKYDYNFGNDNSKKKKRIFFVTIILIISLTIASLLFVSNVIVNDILTKPFEIINNSYNSVTTSLGMYFGNVENLKKKNINLNNEISELKLKLLENQRLIKENESLKVSLEIDSTFQHFNLKSGRIIVRQHDNFSQTFVIDIGEKDGIKLNQAVIHKDGLVGYISNVNDATSNVTTILDPRTSVSVTISTINEPAVLKGNLELKSKNNLKLEYIPIDSELSIGDMLYSSRITDQCIHQLCQ